MYGVFVDGNVIILIGVLKCVIGDFQYIVVLRLIYKLLVLYIVVYNSYLCNILLYILYSYSALFCIMWLILWAYGCDIDITLGYRDINCSYGI